MEEVANEDKLVDCDDTDIGTDSSVSDNGEAVEDYAESDVSDKSSSSEQYETEQSEQSSERDAGQSTEGSSGEETEQSQDSESETESEFGEEPGTEDSAESASEEATESGSEEETTEEVTEEITEPGTEDSKEAGTEEQTGGSVYTGTLSDYLAEMGYEETTDITACLEVIHQDLVQVHTDLQLIATYLTGFVVLIAFYLLYKLFRIFF